MKWTQVTTTQKKSWGPALESKTYKINYSKQVQETLRKIKSYIEDISKSSEIASKKIAEIVDSLDILKIFPEAGFDAYEKYQKVIVEGQVTRGITLKKDYIALYNIDEENSCVNVRYLFSTKSDYMRLFKWGYNGKRNWLRELLEGNQLVSDEVAQHLKQDLEVWHEDIKAGQTTFTD